MRITTNLIICVFAIQFTLGCVASLPEQCRQLKKARYSSEITSEQMIKETDPIKKRKLISEALAEKTRNLKSLKLSDPNLKSIQIRLIKNNEERAKVFEVSLEDYKKINQEYDDLEKDLDFACSNK